MFILLLCKCRLQNPAITIVVVEKKSINTALGLLVFVLPWVMARAGELEGNSIGVKISAPP